MRGGGAVSTSRVSKARPVRARADFAGASAPGGREACTSSTRVFQAPHAVHWPFHLGWTAPQAWQT